MDIAVKIVSAPGEPVRFDAVLDGDDFAVDRNYESAVYASLFSWARDDKSDMPSGFWADSYSKVANSRFGSLIRRVWRSKDVKDTYRLAKEYAEEALEWMVQDGWAEKIEVATDAPRKNWLRWKIIITIDDKTKLPYELEIDLETMRG